MVIHVALVLAFFRHSSPQDRLHFNLSFYADMESPYNCTTTPRPRSTTAASQELSACGSEPSLLSSLGEVLSSVRKSMAAQATAQDTLSPPLEDEVESDDEAEDQGGTAHPQSFDSCAECTEDGNFETIGKGNRTLWDAQLVYPAGVRSCVQHPPDVPFPFVSRLNIFHIPFLTRSPPLKSLMPITGRGRTRTTAPPRRSTTVPAAAAAFEICRMGTSPFIRIAANCV